MVDKKYKITLSETADGKSQYMQIIAGDQFSVNITLIGDFELEDSRPNMLIGMMLTLIHSDNIIDKINTFLDAGLYSKQTISFLTSLKRDLGSRAAHRPIEIKLDEHADQDDIDKAQAHYHRVRKPKTAEFELCCLHCHNSSFCKN